MLGVFEREGINLLYYRSYFTADIMMTERAATFIPAGATIERTWYNAPWYESKFSLAGISLNQFSLMSMVFIHDLRDG